MSPTADYEECDSPTCPAFPLVGRHQAHPHIAAPTYVLTPNLANEGAMPLEQALSYARTYWMFGTEPRTQAALKILHDQIEMLMTDNRPLDPEPWVVHSGDSGDTRFPTREACWLGYRANFLPRTELGYSDRLERYPHD